MKLSPQMFYVSLLTLALAASTLPATAAAHDASADEANWSAEDFEEAFRAQANTTRKKSGAPRGGTSYSNGGITRYSDGSTSYSNGGITRYSDGGTSYSNGGITRYSDGGTSYSNGGITRYSDGRTSYSNGGITRYSDGKTCYSNGGIERCN